MKIVSVTDDTFEEHASALLATSLRILAGTQERVVLGLAGGRSIARLLSIVQKEQVPWGKVHVFQVDERLVPRDDPQRNFHILSQHLSGIIPKKNLHPFPVDLSMDDSGLQSYNKEFARFGGYCDVVVVSAGEDGHIGSVFPHHPSVRDHTEGYILVDHAPKPPLRRISMSLPLLLRSTIGLLLFLGRQKQEAYLKFLNPKVDVVDCPANFIIKLPHSYVLTDLTYKKIKK